MSITITVEEVPDDKKFTSYPFAEGFWGHAGFQAELVVPSMAIVVMTSGRRYKVSCQEIITKVIDYSLRDDESEGEGEDLGGVAVLA